MEQIIISLIIGTAVGFLAGWYFASRFSQSEAPLFTDDEESVEHLHSAQAAVAERTKRRLDRIMQAAQKVGRITNDGVEDLFCISDRTASNYLRLLTKSGRLQRHGTGRGTFYTPVQ